MLQNKPYPAFDKQGHRGGRGLMPENTIPAMLHAINLGVTTLEMDTHVTADGKVIVAHDDYLNPAFALNPDGTEILKSDDKKYPIYQMAYADLRQFDVGSKFYPLFPQQQKLKLAVPLLADLIDSVQNYLKKTGKKQVFYNIETKCDEAGDNILNPLPAVFVEALMDIIKQKKIAPFVVIQSFDKRTLQILNKKYPQIRTSYLIPNDKKTFDINLTELGFTPFIYSPFYKIVNTDLVNACHAKGIKIIPWTVNTKEEISNLKSLNVDGLISDYPNLLN